jgi:hypothetical protein
MVPSALGLEGDAAVFEELLFVLPVCELEFVFFENLQPNKTAASNTKQTTASLLLIDTGISLLLEVRCFEILNSYRETPTR